MLWCDVLEWEALAFPERCLEIRALDGDAVVVEILPTKGSQKHGKVVFVSEMSGTRQVIGTLTRKGRKNAATPLQRIQLTMKPLDRLRFPMIRIPFTAVPDGLKTTVLDQRGNKRVKYLAEVTEWAVYQKDPVARIITCLNPERLRTLGTANGSSASADSDDEVEEDESSIQTTEEADSAITESSSKKEQREDFRDDFTLSIEQADGKSRPHALSCRSLGHEVFRVGIHICDMASHVSASAEASCFWDPSTDCRAHSAVFTITGEGDVLDYREAQGDIRSCSKLCHREAPDMIDEPKEALRQFSRSAWFVRLNGADYKDR
ncbi:hypothetical protein RvY_10548-1 [Ramazzottius varieornatus]|uniref:Uncharacterized protein n=1 Tax=Ramazzottius varieornatus TaxID=947166 RepID=A0A1D1VKW1_RAMVA|nr:hypothetical protein RvY_10548-1 [Ramazzottius varieornatus]